MKEEAPNMLPPKIVGGLLPSSNNTNNNNNHNNTANSLVPTQAAANKIASDEILSSLLRINNFDSISSIKDESLDIDLSACVTISPAGIINGNSLSSSDFWRVLDESAQIPEKEVPNPLIKNEVKEELPSSFSGTFLRPDPPAAITISPVKKLAKSRSHAGEQKRRKLKTAGKPTITVEQLTNNSNSSTLSSPPPPTLSIKTEVTDTFAFGNDAEDGNDMCDYNATECKIEDAPKHKMISLPSFSEIHGVKQQQQVSNSLNVASAIANTPGTITNVSQNVLAFSQTVDLSQMINIANVSGLCNLTSSPAKFTTANGHAKTNNLKLTQNTQQQQFDATVEKAKNQLQSPAQTSQPADRRVLHKCTDCEQEFEQEAALKKHLKTHRTAADGRKDAWKKCPECGKCLKLGSMWMHRKIHSDNRKYECDICGQKFVQKINLTHHARIHTSEKPYECPECQKRFQERSHLQRHQKYHAQTRSYRCDKCGKMYKTERCLKVHNLVHLERRPFACTVCDKSFISNSKLKQHLNIHTGARPFKCNYCPRDFTNFPNWLKHTRRRHKVDHKTGEQLENIPSYCSKKSATPAAANTAATGAGAMSATAAAQMPAANKMTKAQYQEQQPQQIQLNANAMNGAPSIVAENAKTQLKSENTLPKTPTVRRKKKATPTTPALQIEKKMNDDLLAAKAAAAESAKTNANVLIGVDDNAIITTPTKAVADVVTPAAAAAAAAAAATASATTTIALTLTTSLSTTAPMLTKSTNTIAAGTLANKNQTNNITSNNSKNNNNNNNNNHSNNKKITNSNTSQATITPTHIMPKIKRERKQLSPKQVPLELVSQLSPIKTEPNDLERKHLITNFLDLHCLSLTSAEELIMEQALEMEECGLYDAPVSAVFN